MTAKISFLPQSPRSVLNVYAYLLSPKSRFLEPSPDYESISLEPDSYYLSESDYHSLRTKLFATESLVLRTLSFNTHVSLPHHLALTYLQTLGVLPSAPTATSKALAQRTLAHLNTALLSPQLFYLTHQPPALAVAAIYLATRELGVKLTGREWWEVYDVDREELGFLVVGMGSIRAWVEEERAKWADRSCPLNVEEVEHELSRPGVEE
ncbi:Cyclin-L1 [Lambiella insularis]|nr:Cyclin-L1 [Lambiella insularis]